MPTVLAAAAVGGVLWHFCRNARFRQGREAVQALRYSVEHLDRLHHREFEYAVRDLMFRDGCSGAVQVGEWGTTALT